MNAHPLTASMQVVKRYASFVTLSFAKVQFINNLEPLHSKRVQITFLPVD